MEEHNLDFAGAQSYLKFHYNNENFACYPCIQVSKKLKLVLLKVFL